jgi:DNA-directed RNA polymerases I and III subunit RPAC1
MFELFYGIDCLFVCAVKSDELKWLPEGSQLSAASPAQAGDKQKTTSFSQSQKEISEKPLGVKLVDITIARLGPGQVTL